MRLALILIADFLVSLSAPLVTLVYRRGWFNTPDNPTSPHGLYEPFMAWLHLRLGTWLSDWWWLGFRNRAYGFSYWLKPDVFKGLASYGKLDYEVRYDELFSISLPWSKRVYVASKRTITILGYEEHCASLLFFHVIWGYRIRPVYDAIERSQWGIETVVHHPNMDARPIFSVRWGPEDD